MNYGVNIANGNLVVASTDLNVAGPGLNLTVTRLENVLEDFTGWVAQSSELTNSFDTWWAALPDGSIVVNGVRGRADLLYYRKSGSTFIAPAGADATLATSGAATR